MDAQGERAQWALPQHKPRAALDHGRSVDSPDLPATDVTGIRVIAVANSAPTGAIDPAMVVHGVPLLIAG